MIIRSWRARAQPAREQDYVHHFRTNVLPGLRALEGFLGASLLRRDDIGEVEIQVLTKWRSLDAVRAFAGANISHAVVEPEAEAALLSFDKTVTHHDVVVDEMM